MRKVSLFDYLRAKFASGAGRAYTFARNYKKIIYGSVAALAVFVVPFALQSANASLNSDGNLYEEDASIQDKIHPESENQNSDKRSPASMNNDNLEVEVKSESSTNARSKNGEVNVNVNGQHIQVPENGSIHKRITSNENKSVVDVQVDNNSGSQNFSSTSTSIDINQQSFSEGSDESERRGLGRDRIR